MITTPETTTPVAAIVHPDSYRVGFLYGTITTLPDSPAKAVLLTAIDAVEADIIKASHLHGIELDRRSRAAMGRILAEGSVPGTPDRESLAEVIDDALCDGGDDLDYRIADALIASGLMTR